MSLAAIWITYNPHLEKSVPIELVFVCHESKERSSWYFVLLSVWHFLFRPEGQSLVKEEQKWTFYCVHISLNAATDLPHHHLIEAVNPSSTQVTALQREDNVTLPPSFWLIPALTKFWFLKLALKFLPNLSQHLYPKNLISH